MKTLHLLLLLLLLLLPGLTSADPWQPRRALNEPGAFLAGFFSGYAAHELGHILVAETKGFEAEFDGPTLVYPEARMTDAQHLQIASAGFQVQWLLSEAALRVREHRPLTASGDSYNAGIVFSHLAISAAYLTVLKNHEDGDIEGISEATGLSNDQLASLAAIPALLDAWRLCGENVPKWVPAVSIGSKGIGLAVVWTY